MASQRYAQAVFLFRSIALDLFPIQKVVASEYNLPHKPSIGCLCICLSAVKFSRLQNCHHPRGVISS